MLKRFCLVTYGLILSLIIVSCESITYSPEKESYTNITPVSSTDVLIDLNSVGDTLYLFGTADLTYSVKTYGKRFAWINFYLDSVKIGSSYEQNKFTFNTERHADGLHKLKFEIWVGSGSGSLADKAGKEYISCSKEFNLIIANKDLTAPLEIDSIYESDGSLKITWQKYPYINFEKYRIYYEEVGKSGFNLVAEINKKDQNYWIDKNYIGGNCSYRVDAVSKKKVTQGTPKFHTDTPTHLFPPESLNNEKVVLRWSKNKFYNNFSKYTIFKKYSWLDGTVYKIAEINVISDTSFTDNIAFGNTTAYYICVYGGTTYPSSTKNSNTREFEVGNKFPGFHRLNYIPALNSIYINDYISLCIRFDAETLEEKARGKGSIRISNSGSIAFSNDLNFGIPHSFTKVDPFTLQPVGNKFTTESFMKYYSSNHDFAVLEDETCFYAGLRYSNPTEYGPPVCVLLDTDPVKILRKDSSYKSLVVSPIHVSKLTDEGQYVLLGDFLFNIKNNTFSKTNIMSKSAFFLESGMEYLTVSSNAVSIYKCNDNTLVKSFPIAQELENPMIDPATGYLGGLAGGNKYRIYDLNDGRLLKEINVWNGWPISVYMANSYLFSNNGYSMKIYFNK